jgi:1,4-alpha-glucan branching enzyme
MSKNVKNRGCDRVPPQTDSLKDHLYFFHEGNEVRAHRFLGAHFTHEPQNAVFRVWAPEAQSVSVVGDFNEWDAEKHPMAKISVGVWEREITGVQEYDAYKFAVTGRDGVRRDKADPYAFHAETRPFTASKLYDLEGYTWGDQGWMAHRRAAEPLKQPMNVYEVHLGSWRRGGTYLNDKGEDVQAFLSYDELARQIIPYAKGMGYTHIELMPVMEHPLDASWGYQVTGYFAATSRFGTPKQLMAFIDACHKAGLGVILDWVPAHFPKDAHGLAGFDGGCCYEDANPSRREHEGWGTLAFDLGRNEVRSFLFSSALFWLEVFHADALRVDAVASMLYLDFGRDTYIPNTYGGRENLEAVEFFKKLNTLVDHEVRGAMMIAEESTDWGNMTQPAAEDGMGFHFKWNMGWMNDLISYIQRDPVQREAKHRLLTFPLMFAFNEKYILPVSHDEVVHGKGSLLNKMPGFYDDKFAGMRSFYAYMLFHPGKKLTFMGAEFGQFIEWDSERSLDWHLLDHEKHRQLSNCVAALNHFYLEREALWELDGGWEGFSWLYPDDAQANMLSFTRRDSAGRELYCIVHFSPVFRDKYQLGLPQAGTYREVINTDDPQWGGGGRVNAGDLITTPQPVQGHPNRLEINVAPFSAIVLERTDFRAT